MTRSGLAVSLSLGFLAALSWAAGQVASKTLLAQLPPLKLLSGQLLVSSVTLTALAVATGTRLRFRDLRIGWPGLLQPGPLFSLSYVGLQMIPVSLENMLWAAETPLVVILAWPLLGERPSRAASVLVGIAALGVVVLSGSGGFGVPANALAVGLVMTSITAASLSSIATRALVERADPLHLTAMTHAIGFIAVSLIWGASARKFDLPDGKLLLAIAASGVLSLTLPFPLYALLLRRTSAIFASLFLPLVPVMTAALAHVWLGEELSNIQWCAGALVVTAAAACGFITHPSGNKSGVADRDDPDAEICRARFGRRRVNRRRSISPVSKWRSPL